MKKLFFVLCFGIVVLCFGGLVRAEAATVYRERTSVTFHNASPYYIVDDNWVCGKHSAELTGGVLYVSVDDFREAFRVNMSYSYSDLTISLRYHDNIITHTLGQDTLLVNGVAYAVAPSYISSAEGYPVMIALEPFASTMGYTGTFEMKDTYAYGEMTVSIPKIPYTLSRVVVNQAAQLVTVYGKTPDGAEEPVRHMLCSTGVGYRTPNGTFRINPLGNDWYYFPASACYIRYCSQITGNICFHSLVFNTMNKYSLSRTSYNAIGTMASHGCIRLFTADAKYIHQNCRNLPVTIVPGYTDAVTDGIRAEILAHKPSYEEYVDSLPY